MVGPARVMLSAYRLPLTAFRRPALPRSRPEAKLPSFAASGTFRIGREQDVHDARPQPGFPRPRPGACRSSSPRSTAGTCLARRCDSLDGAARARPHGNRRRSRPWAAKPDVSAALRLHQPGRPRLIEPSRSGCRSPAYAIAWRVIEANRRGSWLLILEDHAESSIAQVGFGPAGDAHRRPDALGAVGGAVENGQPAVWSTGPCSSANTPLT